jgi:hypothetical protein
MVQLLHCFAACDPIVLDDQQNQGIRTRQRKLISAYALWHPVKAIDLVGIGAIAVRDASWH